MIHLVANGRLLLVSAGVGMGDQLNRQVLTCPNCGQQLRMPAGRRGTIRCPNCKTSLAADTTNPTGILEIESGHRASGVYLLATSVRDWFWRRRFAFLVPAILLFFLILGAIPSHAPSPIPPSPVPSPTTIQLPAQRELGPPTPAITWPRAASTAFGRNEEQYGPGSRR